MDWETVRASGGGTTARDVAPDDEVEFREKDGEGEEDDGGEVDGEPDGELVGKDAVRLREGREGGGVGGGGEGGVEGEEVVAGLTDAHGHGEGFYGRFADRGDGALGGPGWRLVLDDARVVVIPAANPKIELASPSSYESGGRTGRTYIRASGSDS